MRKDSPTLIDEIVRHSFKDDDLRGARPALLAARRFVLDDSMSSYLSHLSSEPWAANTPAGADLTAKRMRTTEYVRRSARLPYAKTWIEYSPRAYHAEARASGREYLVVPNDGMGNVPVNRLGWLLEQHDLIETAVRCTVFSEVSDPFIMPYGMAWTTDDSPVPWPAMQIRLPRGRLADSDKEFELSAAHLLTGIQAYNTPFVQIVAPGYLVTQYTDRQIGLVMSEFFGELRRVFALLTTINDIPIITKQVLPSKGYVARGQYRKFLAHSTITLTVPHSEIRKHAQRVMNLLRRRAHQVRGHWREDWRNLPRKDCSHDWQPTENRLECSHCNGRKLWVHEHERGDASLGFVTHDHRVTHGEEHE